MRVLFAASCFAFLLCVTNVILGENLITEESAGIEFLDWYNTELSEVEYNYWTVQWQYYTNITDFNQNKTVEADVLRSKFIREAAKNASHIDWKKFQNETVKRMFWKITRNVGPTALGDPEKMKQVHENTA
ncbi:angiotensin-converting enzyme-like [Saccostrea cucullata]|uniref:angiotensin-converting enzyme-like n=1 Tax=Saccostrea cuccullata TaxID=36930 RepID=UPI002ED6980A